MTRRCRTLARMTLTLVVGCRPQGPEEPNPVPSASVEFVQPWFQLPDGRTEAIAIWIDGSRVGDCHRDERDAAKVCTETELSPGPHVVRVHLDYRDDTTMRLSASKYYTMVDTFVAAPGERLTFDLSKAESKTQKDYLAREGGARGASTCARKLHAALAANPCNAAGMKVAAEALDGARLACARTSDDGPESAALYDLEQNLFGLDPERCFVPDALGKLWRIAIDRSVSGFPRGTVEQGSWWWARDTRAEHEDARSLGERVAGLRKALDPAIDRQQMLDEFLGAWTDDRQPTAAIEHAIEGELELDPRSIAGHRAWLLLFDDEHADPRVAKWLATELVRGKSHCGLADEAGPVVGYFAQDGTLDADEWRAVQAMVSRTPADEEIAGACIDVVRADLQSTVHAIDRLRWMAKFDCSDRRHPRLRADAVREWVVGGQASRTDGAAAHVQKELVACVGSPN